MPHPAPLDPGATDPEPVARVVSGEAVELEVRVARVGSRAVALLLDVIVQLTALVILIMLSVMTIVSVFGSSADGALIKGAVFCCLGLVFIGYPVLLETLAGGRTLGKLAMGVRVVRDDGGPIQFRHALTRALVGVSVEWPGLLLPPLTWVCSLGMMLLNRHGKRLGDLTAGTIVIHERSPASWGWVPAMPPGLAGWAATLDLTGLEDDLALSLRHFLSRGRLIAEPDRTLLGRALAAEVARCTTPGPPPGIPGWAYLAAVLAERHRRSAFRLARARSVTAALWPDLLPATLPVPATTPSPPTPTPPTPAPPPQAPPTQVGQPPVRPAAYSNSARPM